MRTITDTDLYLRGCATAVACWTACATASPGASVLRVPGATAAVFPTDPDRSIYNNAILDGGLGGSERAEAIDAVEAAYAAAGIDRFAAWVHEGDWAMVGALERRGYRVAETTRAMGLALSDLRPTPGALDLVQISWETYLRVFGLPEGLLDGMDPERLRVRVAARDGAPVATSLAYDHDGDCGIFNVLTVEGARRRGLGTAMTALQLRDAIERGCATASLQSTPMAESVYAALGFRDLGRIREYVP